MWSDLALSGGLSALKNGMSFIQAGKDADAKRAWQSYKNAMTQLSGANSQNILTTNENMARENSADQAFQIGRSEYITNAQAEVSAAASNTGGRSVNDVLFSIDHNAADAQAKRKSDLQDQYLQIDNQRKQVAFQVATQMDYSPIPEPNPATYMLNFATDATKLYQSSKPR
jgi:hypothetical protein